MTREPSVDDDLGTVDIGAEVGGEEQRRTSDLVRMGEPPERDAAW